MLLLVASLLVSQPQKVTSLEGITEWSLPNGMRVLTFPDASKPTITVNVTYLVGSRHEDYGETGMAHLLEHLMFKGTPTHKNVPQELTEHGARANGTTSYDRTNYYETFPATDENLTWALRLESDRMLNSFIAKKDLDSEMTVVRNEFESGENSPGGVLMQRTLSTAYLWHNYGKSTIGARSDIEQVPIERLQAFYRKYYQPDNAVLIVAGRFDEKKTLAQIAELFGKLPKPVRPAPRTYTQEPTQDGERSVTLRRTGDVQVLNFVYHVPAGAHEDFASVDIIAGVFGSAPYGRLYKALVDTKKAARVSGGDIQLYDPGVLLFSVELRKEQNAAEAREIALKTLESPADITSEELERSRAELLKQVESTQNSVDRLGVELSDWVGLGDWRLFFLHRDRIKKASLQDAQRVARTYLKSSNRTAGQFVPTDKPDRAEMPEVKGLADTLAAFKGDAPTVQGEAFDTSPENIEARTKRSSTKSGLKVAELYKKTRNEVVNLSLNLRFGTEKTLAGKDVAASVVAPMLLRGTKNKTREQIKDALDKLKARLSLNGTPTNMSVSLEVEKKNLQATLALLGEVLREPRFDAKELDLVKQERLASLESQRSQPQSVGMIAFQRHTKPWPKGHPLYVMDIDESVAGLTALKQSDVKEFYEAFYGATNGELAVVGDFDAQVITRFIGGFLASWNSQQPYARIVDGYRKIASKDLVLETPDKANAFLVAGTTLQIKESDPDYPALVLGNYMLGGGFLNSRLATRIRQKEGLSYGVGSVLSGNALDPNALFMLYAIYAPENLGRLEAAYKEELTRALKDGFTDEEVKAAQSGLLQSRQVSRSQDGSLAGLLAQTLYVGRTLQFDGEMDKKLAALDGKAIGVAMRKYLDVAGLTAVKAGDFKKKKS